MSRGDPQGKICRHIRLPGFVRACGCGIDIGVIWPSVSTGVVDSVGSPTRGASRFCCPARKFHESAVMYSSSGSGDDGARDKIAVRATRGLTILDRPCSTC